MSKYWKVITTENAVDIIGDIKKQLSRPEYYYMITNNKKLYDKLLKNGFKEDGFWKLKAKYFKEWDIISTIKWDFKIKKVYETVFLCYCLDNSMKTIPDLDNKWLQKYNTKWHPMFLKRIINIKSLIEN